MLWGEVCRGWSVVFVWFVQSCCVTIAKGRGRVCVGCESGCGGVMKWGEVSVVIMASRIVSRRAWLPRGHRLCAVVSILRDLVKIILAW